MAKLRDHVITFCLGLLLALCLFPRSGTAALSPATANLREQRSELLGLKRISALRAGNPVRSSADPAAPQRPAFDAVPTDHWAYQALQHLNEQGLLDGYPDGFFKGDRPLTRVEFAEAISRMLPTAGADDKSQLAAVALRTEFSAQLDEIQAEMARLQAELSALQERLGTLQDAHEAATP